MPPYDYDSGPIVKQRPVLAFPFFDPKATEQLSLCAKKMYRMISDPTTRSMRHSPFAKVLDEIHKHVENGADFTGMLNEILTMIAIEQDHTPLLKALLERGGVLHIYNFTFSSVGGRNTQRLLLTNCKYIATPEGENVLHTDVFLHKPEDVYYFCRHGVDATQQGPKGDTPLHTLMEESNFRLHRRTLIDIKLTTLEKVAALTWKHAQLSAKNNAGKTPLDLLTGEAIDFRQDVEHTAKATEQERDKYVGTQQATQLLLKQHIAQALVPIVMGYAQPTWLHDIWPKIKDNAGIAKIALEDRTPAPLGMRARIWRALQVAFALRNNK